MGYHISIVRTRNGGADPVAKAEVESLIESMPGSRLEHDDRSVNIEKVVFVRDGKEVSWLSFQAGRLWTKNPDDDEIEVMIDVAKQLNARVRGDDFETFLSPSETFLHPDDRVEIQRREEAAQQFSKSVRSKQSKLNLSIVLIFLLLAGLATYFSR
jgi:hypothetical protein